MYPKPYLDYLVQFHAERDYFECHEILEEYWKSAPPEKRKPVWVGLIQIAVSLYHQRRGNYGGAVKMMDSALQIVQKHQQAISNLGLDALALIVLLEQRLKEMKQGVSYRSFNLPFGEERLRQEYEQACRQQNLLSYRESDLDNAYLMNKHTLRDRSDVHEERRRQLARKEQARSGQSRQPD